jgi:hypothetical protein
VVDHEWHAASAAPIGKKTAETRGFPNAATAAASSAKPHSAENIQNRSQRGELTQEPVPARSWGVVVAATVMRGSVYS